MLLHYGHERYVSEYWIPWNKYILILINIANINSANSGCHETASEHFWLWMLSFSFFFFSNFLLAIFPWGWEFYEETLLADYFLDKLLLWMRDE